MFVKYESDPLYILIHIDLGDLKRIVSRDGNKYYIIG